MSDRVLVVRTTSIEELGPLLENCRARWTDARICVLTSPNRVAELRTDRRIDEILAYETAGSGFGAPWNDGRSYRALIVPVRNARGWSYGNVWEAVAGVKAASLWIAAWSRELRAVSLRRMLFRVRIERFLQAVCAPAAWGISRLYLMRFYTNSKGTK